MVKEDVDNFYEAKTNLSRTDKKSIHRTKKPSRSRVDDTFGGRPKVNRSNCKCLLCGRTETPQWRFMEVFKNDHWMDLVCNACYMKYHPKRPLYIRSKKGPRQFPEVPRACKPERPTLDEYKANPIAYPHLFRKPGFGDMSNIKQSNFEKPLQYLRLGAPPVDTAATTKASLFEFNSPELVDNLLPMAQISSIIVPSAALPVIHAPSFISMTGFASAAAVPSISYSYPNIFLPNVLTPQPDSLSSKTKHEERSSMLPAELERNENPCSPLQEESDSKRQESSSTGYQNSSYEKSSSPPYGQRSIYSPATTGYICWNPYLTAFPGPVPSYQSVSLPSGVQVHLNMADPPSGTNPTP